MIPRPAAGDNEATLSHGREMFRTAGCRLILASASPRRRVFLEELGLDFELQAADVEEIPAPGETPEEFVRRLAMEKAAAVARLHPEAWVLGADTVVVLDNDILGKPGSVAGAKAMLRRLSGRSHEVWTGFCIFRQNGAVPVQQAVKTEVRFITLSEQLCDAYVMTGDPLDKAGGYGIQGKGGFLVERITGSYSNVVGLPLAELVRELLALGVIRPATSAP